MQNTESKTPVTILQELLLKMKVVPAYNLILDGCGTHEPIFKYNVTGGGHTATGTGKSKKEAKHNAASQLLQALKNANDFVQSVSDDVASPYEGVLKENAVGELSDFCISYQLRLPEYKLTRDEGLPHAKVFSWSCTVSSFTTEATARTKKNAKQMAAQEMLLKLKDCLIDIIQSKSAEPSPNASPQRQSLAEMESVMDIVIKKLSKSSIRISTADRLGTNLADLCFSLKEDNLHDVPYLEFLKEKETSSRGYFLDSQAKGEFKQMVAKITEEMNCGYEVRATETTDPEKVAVILIIKSMPSWTFVAVNRSLNVACDAVFEDAVRFMVKMRE